MAYLLFDLQVTGDVRGLRVGVVQEGLANCEADVIEVRERGSHTQIHSSLDAL
jgi:hypothetical protein